MTLAAASKDAGHVRAATMPGQCDGVKDISAVPSKGQYNKRRMAGLHSQNCLTEIISLSATIALTFDLRYHTSQV